MHTHRSKLLLDDLRGRVRELKTSRAELRAWWGGLSAKIASLHEAVEELHGEIIEGGSRDRRRLAAEGYANALAKHSGARSQERRSTILSLMGQDDFALSSASRCGPAGETPRPDEEWYPSPRCTDSPPPILENDALYRTRSNPRARARASLHDDAGHAAISDAGNLDLSPDPLSSFVSDADLKHLLALALAPSRSRYEKGRRHRALRRDVLLRLGKHLLGPDASYDNRSEVSSHTQHTKRARLKAAKSRMRGTQGSPSQGMAEAASGADVNEVSAVVEKGDECDAMEWQDE
ncbi:hypothetical protein TRAPUB_1189 [Trametes pubescens]|uniref:Uncharacterized protein n=1 Tax=Trametes pubescens TaxID=154538 RepID=A0A1M2VK15_TRAPU|nr:hypothetical protein TRAPUB_1189 [Trametes pubescens]